MSCCVAASTREDRSAAAALAAARVRLAYARYGVAPERLESFALGRGARLIENRDVLVWAAQDAGFACATYLPWDSEQFGFPAARLDCIAVESAVVDAVVEGCRQRGIRHLTARVDSGDLSSVHALEQAGFEMIDGIQTSSLRLAETRPGPSRNGLRVRLFSPGDLEGVLAIARSSYVYDRFHADRALSTAMADAVNEAWLRNSCLGTAADAVVIAADGAEVLGYVTCKIDAETGPALGLSIGTIVMVATAEAARGRGVGRAATFGALDWFAARGVDVVEVGTQLRNIPAARLYASCGFRPIAVSLTFRKIL